MKPIYTIVPYLIMLAFFMACTEDYKIDYPKTIHAEIVIEALICDKDEAMRIFVSKTTIANDSLAGIGVNDALVQISDEYGMTEVLEHYGDGKYKSSKLKGIVGYSYKLQVEVDDQIYEAEEEMLPGAKIDSLFAVELIDDEYFDDGFYLKASVNLPKDSILYSRVEIAKNDSVYNNYVDLLLFESSFLSGPSEILIPYTFEVGDTVQLNLYSISENVYNYLNAYYQITTGFFGVSIAPMQNPPSNISGNCLGYFQVSAKQSFELVIE